MLQRYVIIRHEANKSYTVLFNFAYINDNQYNYLNNAVHYE